MEAPEPVSADQAETLEEFCAAVSLADKRVELVAGFYADERRSGRFHDTRAAWESRFAAFQRRPVS